MEDNSRIFVFVKFLFTKNDLKSEISPSHFLTCDVVPLEVFVHVNNHLSVTSRQTIVLKLSWTLRSGRIRASEEGDQSNGDDHLLPTQVEGIPDIADVSSIGSKVVLITVNGQVGWRGAVFEWYTQSCSRCTFVDVTMQWLIMHDEHKWLFFSVTCRFCNGIHSVTCSLVQAHLGRVPSLTLDRKSGVSFASLCNMWRPVWHGGNVVLCAAFALGRPMQFYLTKKSNTSPSVPQKLPFVIDVSPDTFKLIDGLLQKVREHFHSWDFSALHCGITWSSSRVTLLWKVYGDSDALGLSAQDKEAMLVSCIRIIQLQLLALLANNHCHGNQDYVFVHANKKNYQQWFIKETIVLQALVTKASREYQI